MKYIAFFIFSLSLLSFHAHAEVTPASTSETDKIFTEIDKGADFVAENTPEGVKTFFGKMFTSTEVWRIKTGNEFAVKRDEAMNKTSVGDDSNNIFINNEGNIEVETGIGRVLNDPQNYFWIYTYVALVFIFLNIFIFYGLAILVVLFVLKILVKMFTRTT